MQHVLQDAAKDSPPQKTLRVLAAPVAFNEEARIGSVLDRFRNGLVDELVVVDDASTDNTREVVRTKGVKLLCHEKRKGVGAAIRTAIQYARENGFDVIVILAGNDKDRPDEIPRLIEAIEREGYDFVQGSRHLQGGQFSNMPFYRRIATQFVHPILFSLFTRRRITDSTNGFRAIRLAILENPRINLDQEWLNKYELEPYLMYQTIKLGYRFKEVPVTKIYPSRIDYTKMKPVVDWWGILRPLFMLSLRIKK